MTTTIAPNKTASKLRDLAQRIDAEVENKRQPSSQNPTPKRLYQEKGRLIEANHLERVAQVLRTLADYHDMGYVPEPLAKLTSKAALLPLLKTRVTSPGYYSLVDTGEFSDKSEVGRAVQALIGAKDPEVERLETIRTKERELIHARVPGFFQTPPAVVRHMVELADIKPGHLCLEPSAGNGNIADHIPGCDVCEVNHTLRSILELKGHRLVGSDFLDFGGRTYDRILMNPPFEKGADMEHVQHAFDLLAERGRLVAILSPAYTFHSTAKASAFREWIADKLDHEEELPAGTFQGPSTITQTGVAARLIVLTR